MKLIDRYLLREYLVATAYCLAAFSLLYLVIDLFERLPLFLAAGVSWPRIAIFYGQLLMAINGPTSFFTLILPISMLMGLLYSLHNFCRHNELTAMRACGIGLFRLMAPYFGIGLAASGICLLIQEQVAPRASLRVKAMERVLRGAPDAEPPLSQHPFFYSAARRHWMIGVLDPQAPHRLDQVRITTEREDRSRASELTAERAEWMDGAWWFFGATERHFDENERPLAAPSAPTQLPIEKRFFEETPHDILGGIRSWDLFSARGMLSFIRNNPGLSPDDRARRMVDLHIRLTMPWVCLMVTFLGIPGGVRTHRQGALAGILSAIFFVFVFYTLLQVGSYLGKRQIIPPWAGAWFPNVAFITVGLHLLRRMR